MSTTGEQAMADRLRDLEVEVARLGASLTTKIDGLTDSIRTDRRDSEKREADIETRIRALEAARQWATGVAWAGGGVLGLAGGVLVDWLAGR